MGDYAARLRATANAALSRYEPVVLVAGPLVALLAAWAVHILFSFVREKGAKGAAVGAFMASVKLIPGVNGYIQSEKKKVADKLQSSVKSKRDSWRTELPGVGLGMGVLEKLQEDKEKDVTWQGKCSGTVYIGGSELEGHFTLINEAYSMLESIYHVMLNGSIGT
ncbi:hypothetical protein Taro_048102 [Colocasia esculenta]|uniref:Uncharacterized protein n=1 Tax=Colocasia esculenta TaxID=4460 RepID=A0A843WX87_COLES|nr:hypothetical protein [Colocasia esculenta]